MKHRLLKMIASAGFLFWMCLFADAQMSPSVTASADRNEILIADPVTVTIEVTADATSRAAFPEFSRKVGEFEILDQKQLFGIPTLNDPKLKTWSLKLILETLETGELSFPTIEVVVTSESGSKQRLRTDPILIKVGSSIETGSDPTSFHDIRDLIDAPSAESESSGFLWTAIGVATGLAFAGSVGFFALTRRRRWMTPTRWAKSCLANREGITISRIEVVLREYIRDEFGLPASSWTLSDFDQFSDEMQLPEEHASSLHEFFERAQLQKFAGLNVSEPEVNRWADSIESLIDLISQKSREEV